MNISEIIKSLTGLKTVAPATQQEIDNAERLLGLTFAEDYKTVLSNFGLVSAQGIELAGISNFKFVDVVSLTENERKYSKLEPKYYVIESLHIDDVVAVQDESGCVYMYQNGKISEAADSLGEYLLSINS